MRQVELRHLLVLALLSTSSPTAAFAWPPGGVPVTTSGLVRQLEPHLLAGRNGTVFAYWSDYRWPNNTPDIYGQLLSPYGDIAPAWADTGLMIMRARGSQQPASGLTSPDGSFIVGAFDFRNGVAGGTRFDIYLSRVLADGRVDPTWPRDGFQASALRGDESPRRMVWAAPDTLVACSGTILQDGSSKIFFQRVAITPTGPVAVWGLQAVLHQFRPNEISSTLELQPDGEGGVFVFFDELLPFVAGLSNSDLYLMRLGRDGQAAPGWEAGARAVSIAPGVQEDGAMCSDGEGGFYVTWGDAREAANIPDVPYQDYEDIRLLRLDHEGAPYAGWPTEGVLLTNAPGWQDRPALLPDGTGGVYVAWNDITIGLTRVQGNGVIVPGWPANGIQISDLFAYALNARMVLDQLGGVYVLFEDFGRDDLYLQHVLPHGVVDPSWPSIGEKVGILSDGDIVTDGAGGCYVGFVKQLVPFETALGVMVSRYSMDGPVPVKLAEAVVVEAEAGRVHLVWRGGEISPADTRVQRRGESSEAWLDLGAPVPRGRDELEYEDTRVEPGARYAYRLVRGAEVLSQEQWLTVPTSAVFALAGAWPNPAPAHELTVRFTLAGGAAGDGAARLEVIDLAGRREHVRTLTGLDAGRHTLSLADAGLAPGVHWLRLTEGTHSAHTRVIVVR